MISEFDDDLGEENVTLNLEEEVDF